MSAQHVEHHGYKYTASEHTEHGKIYSSSSVAKMSATEATLWPSSRLITRTPVASRPWLEISFTAMRMVTPPDDTATMSSSIPTMKAAAQGVKTIDYDRLTLNGSASYYVSFDNEAVGRLQGEGIKSCLDAAGKSKARIVYLNGSPTDNNATLFKAGYDSVLRPLIDSKAYTLVDDQAVPDWDNKILITQYKGSETKENIENKTQDLISYLYQFNYENFDEPIIEFVAATGKKYKKYQFRVIDKKVALSLGNTNFETTSIQSIAEKDGKPETQIWLSNKLYKLPIRIRYQEKNGSTLEQNLVQTNIDLNAF